jgi:acetoin utilization deacetylase AcuC-like enzyme
VANTEGKPFSRLDADTGLSARSYEIARLAVGGLLNAVDALFTPNSALRTPHSVFAFVRPPGHHAETERGMGFCLFNNVAIAAEYAKERYGLRRILIVDWDLHHGNGTQRSFYDDPSVLFFSSHQYPHYPGTGDIGEVGSGAGEGFTVNAPFPSGFGDAEYEYVYRNVLRPIALEYRPELVIVSAGFDPYVKDPLGGLNLTARGFGAIAQIVSEIAQATCGGRTILSLEGGYNPEGLREGNRAVLNVLMGHPPALLEGAPSSASRDLVKKIVSVQKKYWKSMA